MIVARTVIARTRANRMYADGFTGELGCQSCGKTQQRDLFTVLLKGDKGGYEFCCGDQTKLQPLKAAPRCPECDAPLRWLRRDGVVGYHCTQFECGWDGVLKEESGQGQETDG